MKRNITITLKATKGSLTGDPLSLKELYDRFRIKHPNAYYLMKNSRGKWDGYVKYISEYGDFQIGLLPSICNVLKEKKISYIIDDQRLPLKVKPKLIKSLGNGKFQLRENQLQGLKDFINNKVNGFPFYIGVINAATNYGKTLLMSAIHESFSRKLKTLVLINNSQIFAQAKKEYKEYLPGENIQFVQGKDLKFGNFTVGMVQTLSQKVKLVRQELSQIDIVLVDEADVADNKQFRTVLNHLYNTRIRLGLSGSIYLSKLKKDLIHNTNLRCFFGDEVHITTKEDMIKSGNSTPVIIKIVKGNNKQPSLESGDWLEVFKEAVIENKVAHELSAKRVLFNLKYNRLPAIVVTRFIPHSIALFEYYKTHKELSKYRIYRLDHNTPKKTKEWALERFKSGHIDILIVTYIIKRGINLPISVYMQNAAGSNSEEDIYQLCGRMERKSQGKKKSYLDDMYYYGPYLERHSKHRVNYYIRTKMKVINLIKKKK